MDATWAILTGQHADGEEDNQNGNTEAGREGAQQYAGSHQQGSDKKKLLMVAASKGELLPGNVQSRHIICS